MTPEATKPQPKKHSAPLSWGELVAMAASRKNAGATREVVLNFTNAAREFSMDLEGCNAGPLRQALLDGAPLETVARLSGFKYVPDVIQWVFHYDPAAAVVWLMGDFLARDLSILTSRVKAAEAARAASPAA